MSDIIKTRRSQLPIASDLEITDSSWVVFDTAAKKTMRTMFSNIIRLMFGNIKVAKLQLAQQEVLNLNSAPKDIINAPGAGRLIEVITAGLRCDKYSGASYTTNTTIQLITDTATHPQFELVNGLNFSTNTHKRLAPVVSTAANSVQMVENQAVKIYVPNGNPGGSGSDITVYCLYRIIDL